MGGYDRGGVESPETTPYYASVTEEVLFHDITRIPNRNEDQQQIHKVTIDLQRPHLLETTCGQ